MRKCAPRQRCAARCWPLRHRRLRRSRGGTGGGQARGVAAHGMRHSPRCCWRRWSAFCGRASRCRRRSRRALVRGRCRPRPLRRRRKRHRSRPRRRLRSRGRNAKRWSCRKPNRRRKRSRRRDRRVRSNLRCQWTLWNRADLLRRRKLRRSRGQRKPSTACDDPRPRIPWPGRRLAVHHRLQRDSSAPRRSLVPRERCRLLHATQCSLREKLLGRRKSLWCPKDRRPSGLPLLHLPRPLPRHYRHHRHHRH